MNHNKITPDPEYCVFRHVSRTARAVASAYDRALSKAGMSAQQFNVLMTLQRRGSQNVGQLAKLIGMDPSTLPRTLRPLSGAAWVQIDVGADKRRRIISITAPGVSALETAIPLWESLQCSFLENLGPQNWIDNIDQLRKIRSAAPNTRDGPASATG